MKRILSMILALMLLCSCASAPKTGRVSEEELAKLREEYPYRDGHGTTLNIDLDNYQKPDTVFDWILSREASYSLAEIQILSEPYYTVVHKDYPGHYKDLEDFMRQHPDLDEKAAKNIFFMSLNQQFDAKLIEVLWGSSELAPNTTFSLMIHGMHPIDTVDVFEKDGRYICILVPQSYNVGPHPVQPHSMNKYLTWHVTKNDVVLSATSEPGLDYFSGLYLESFKQEVLTILNEELEELP